MPKTIIWLTLIIFGLVGCTSAPTVVPTATRIPATATATIAPTATTAPAPTATIVPTPTATVSTPVATGGDPMLTITSSAFEPGAPIPARYSCDGDDISPPLAWAGVPAGTQSFALIFDDPDAPVGTWDHWLLFNLPADTRTLPENATLPAGTQVGKNSWGRTDYGGPCPPRGTHRYFFKLYALDAPLSLAAGASKSEIEAAMNGHILAQAELMGTFTR